MAEKQNITNAEDLVKSGLKPGDRIHLAGCHGQATEDAFYLGPLETQEGVLGLRPYHAVGIRCRIGKRDLEVYWGDIMELWKVELPKPDDDPPAAA